MKRLALVLTLLFLPVFAQNANGCSCIAMSPSEGFDKAQAVFTGKVITSKKSSWRVVVDRVWKGTVLETITLRDPEPGSSCGSSFTRDERYLFLVDISGSGNKIKYVPQV